MLVVSLFLMPLMGDPSISVVPSRGLFVVPGLGRPDRLETTIHNLKQLQEESQRLRESDSSLSTSMSRSGIQTISRLPSGTKAIIQWDCVIYIYASRLDAEFWSQHEGLSFLSQHCELVENPNKRVTENMYMIQPALLQATYDYVFLLLDDIKIVQQADFQLHRMIEIIHCNQLTVVSPMVRCLLSIIMQMLKIAVLFQ
jgi:hypothetical protein